MPKNATIPRETVTTWQRDNFRRKSDNAGTRSSNISGTRIDCEVIRPLRVPLLPSGPPHNILAIFLVPPPYNGRLDFGEQRRNAKKHVKCHNQNVKWLMSTSTLRRMAGHNSVVKLVTPSVKFFKDSALGTLHCGVTTTKNHVLPILWGEDLIGLRYHINIVRKLPLLMRLLLEVNVPRAARIGVLVHKLPLRKSVAPDPGCNPEGQLKDVFPCFQSANLLSCPHCIFFLTCHGCVKRTQSQVRVGQ
ncbi:hypothetical protein C8F04DRAFT_1199658 [Mycena alexandri]|uniref:Uncharacterized protein n=1 Tax=Mycena alexandri TaxID=1745969 RepID=A0AAD6WMD6_9AGAR|nr:hypothetical protein C8F04DRAFT_1199658 [Mycena alexandri]